MERPHEPRWRHEERRRKLATLAKKTQNAFEFFAPSAAEIADAIHRLASDERLLNLLSRLPVTKGPWGALLAALVQARFDAERLEQLEPHMF